MSVDGRQIADRSIDADRLSLNTLTTSELGSNSVGTTEIVDAAVTAAKLDTAYQAQLGTLTKGSQSFANISGVTATTPVEVNDEDSQSFPDASTTGTRATFDIPNELASGNVLLYLRVSPSTSFSGNFQVDVDYRINGGALAGATTATITPSATADVQTLLLAKTFTSGTLSAGDGLVVRVRRIGADAADTHTGAMRLFRMVLRYPV